jgi:hypothetical protein
MNPTENRVDYGNFVPRSREHILNFPVAFRWEITRRHPYYLALWQTARKYHQSNSFIQSAENTEGLSATLALGAIGVSGETIPPDTTNEQFLECDPIFLCGSVQPITIRYLLILLLKGLGSNNQEYFGRLLSAAASHRTDISLSQQDRDVRMLAMLATIAKRQDKELDSVFEMPLFQFHLNASQETIKEDANRQAKLWKERRGLGSPKIHTAKLPRYLDVWDRIEGWTGMAYDTGRERKFRDLVSSNQKSISTLYDQYRAAFLAIVGVEFSSQAWWNTMGRYKLAQFQDQVHESHVWLARHRFNPIDRVTRGHSSGHDQSEISNPID